NSSTSTDWIWDLRTFTTNQVLFIVGSYTFGAATASDDVCKMWINPNATNFGSASEPLTSLVATNGADLTANQIASFVFLQRAINEPALMLADELRLGKSWAEVTPFPFPFITLTGLKKLSDGTFQFAYTNNSNQSYEVYASANLLDWALVGSATQVSSNWYQFTDSSATNYSRRFYQLR
ncbi:MAG: hypothetical protein ACR2H1_00830, partial [Limisphaerales bacterium]